MSIPAILSTLVAVLGTLAGTALAALMRNRADKAARDSEHRRAVVAAVADLVAALADHRRTMWVLEDTRLSGASNDICTQARADSHATRSAVSSPQVRVLVLAPELASVADAAVRATYALHDAPDTATLSHLRQASVDACDRLMHHAAEALR